MGIVLFLEECNACGALEERVFTDSWTGKEICAACLGYVLDYVTNSPASEGDNFIQLLVDNDLMETDEDYEGKMDEEDDDLG